MNRTEPHPDRISDTAAVALVYEAERLQRRLLEIADTLHRDALARHAEVTRPITTLEPTT